MPVYGKAVFDAADLPDWQPRFDGDKGYGRVADDATTWTMDGKSTLTPLNGPTDEERDRGLIFLEVTASFYIVAHADYVRSVRIVPKGPESIDLVVEWLLPAAAGDTDSDTIDQIRALPMLVIEQDGVACELNQQGLQTRAFDRGILVPQEYELWHFHEWLRGRLGTTEPGA